MKLVAGGLLGLLASACANGGGNGPVDAPPFNGTDGPMSMQDAPSTIDARMVDCPPGLPMSFGNLGMVTANKNGPGSPAMFETYNVFVDLDNNPRWFFAMNLHENRGIFVNGFEFNKVYEIRGDDTVQPECSLCINLFADLDQTDGGPSQHMFPSEGRLILTGRSADMTAVSGRLEDVVFRAIDIVYDAQSRSCSDDINDPVCENSICLNNHCGRQENLVGCETSIKGMTF